MESGFNTTSSEFYGREENDSTVLFLPVLNASLVKEHRLLDPLSPKQVSFSTPQSVHHFTHQRSHPEFNRQSTYANEPLHDRPCGPTYPTLSMRTAKKQTLSQSRNICAAIGILLYLPQLSFRLLPALEATGEHNTTRCLWGWRVNIGCG